MTDILVVGAGPAGVLAALRAADSARRPRWGRVAPSGAWRPTTDRFVGWQAHHAA